MVARHGHLRLLLLDDEVGEVLLAGELIAQSHAVVEEPEAYGHLPLVHGLRECHAHLVVVVAYLAFLAPYRLPCLIAGSRLVVLDLKARHHVGLARHLLAGGELRVVKIRGFLRVFFLELETQV